MFEDVEWICLAHYRLLVMGFLELAINLNMNGGEYVIHFKCIISVDDDKF